MIGKRNLAPERGPNVWDEEGWSHSAAARSRWLRGLGGAAIAVTGAALAAVGGSMIFRATRSQAPGATTAVPETDMVSRKPEARDDIVTDESDASFPASDAPSWTLGAGANMVNPSELRSRT